MLLEGFVPWYMYCAMIRFVYSPWVSYPWAQSLFSLMGMTVTNLHSISFIGFGPEVHLNRPSEECPHPHPPVPLQLLKRLSEVIHSRPSAASPSLSCFLGCYSH